ncbi:uncharacterized protein LOC133190890 isoform X2 [Saccostrea echinata]|uniref:uncharacterized protein LOC133190890 isoform X2 n=1 Tax=Saccostrea echinata TaxID=191078 RepID=UPI002A7FE572|nr:uncharacterized protein LOC133190890 isoform X2 [Saccostrea echinata]
MSVSDPLLKRLKGFVLEFRTKNIVVTDDNEDLAKLCCVLEEIFQKGIKKSRWFDKSDFFWSWVAKIPSFSKERCNPILSMVIDTVKDSKKVTHDLGRGRLFIRSALMKKMLTVPVQIISKNRQLAKEVYYENDSILGNEILAEILQSLLFELTEANFQLRIHNASFLDKTWNLPIYRQYELVPCDNLGLHVQYINGFLLVKAVEPGSVAEENDKIHAGDIIDELCGETLRGNKMSAAHNILQKYKGLPLHVHVVKGFDSQGNLYKPIQHLIEDADIDITTAEELLQIKKSSSNGYKKPPHTILSEEDAEELPVHGSEGGATYEAHYLGYVPLGIDGRVVRIEDSVLGVLRNHTQRVPVRIELTEKDVLVVDKKDDKILLQHGYTEISACGRRTDQLQHIAYIAGETTCSLAKKFNCYVFEARTNEEVRF